MNRRRYTKSQVLCGLRDAWQDFTANDDPIDADTRIDTYMKADGAWEELDFADIFRGIESFFGFSCDDADWLEFFGFDVAERSLDDWDREIAPKLTFGSLARFIAERAPMVASFEPISFFGRDCAPAGVFLGIQRVADKATDRPLRFPPSARIIDVMRGHELDNFWRQVRWMTEHMLPELPACWRDATSVTGCLGVAAVVAALILSWATSNPIWIAPTLVLALASYLAASAYKRITNPLPSHIVTFRDLSMMVANEGP